MKKTTILLCVSALLFHEVYAIGLNSEAMARKTDLKTLRMINNMEKLPMGVAPLETAAEVSPDDYYQLIQAMSLMLAVNFTVWNKYTIYDSNLGGNRTSTIIPLLLMFNMPWTAFSPDTESTFLKNFIVGVWLGYYKDGYKDNDIYDYQQSYSTFMFGLLATLYLNEYLKMQQSRLLLYATIKFGLLFQKDKWNYGGDGLGEGSASSTKFGVFPAIGAEYFIINQLAVFLALGYNPYGWGEFGLKVRFGE